MEVCAKNTSEEELFLMKNAIAANGYSESLVDRITQKNKDYWKRRSQSTVI